MNGLALAAAVGGGVALLGVGGYVVYKATRPAQTTQGATYTQTPPTYSGGGVSTTQTSVPTNGADTWAKDLAVLGGLAIQGYEAYNS